MKLLTIKKLKKIYRNYKNKRNHSISTIGGADGPTSIFFVSLNHTKKSPKEHLKKFLYQQKRNHFKKIITANPHTLEEVIIYLKRKYNAIEVSQKSSDYLMEYHSLRTSLIIKHKPELLGNLSKIEHPKNHDAKTLQSFFKQIELREKKAKSIPNYLFPMDFHIYKITLPEGGHIEFDIDKNFNILYSSYSGNKKETKQLQYISKNVHLYYGVSIDDIKQNSERYSSLLTVLCS